MFMRQFGDNITEMKRQTIVDFRLSCTFHYKRFLHENKPQN
jgi:hypothetical protein